MPLSFLVNIININRLPEDQYITASCIVENNSVVKNGNLVFDSNGTSTGDFFTSLYKYLETDYARFYKMDNLSKLGWLASEVLLKDSFAADKYKPEETGIVLANANASLDTDIKYFETVKEIASPSVFVYTLPNIVTGEICIRNHFKGETAFFVSENFDANFITGYVQGLLNADVLQACICGWIELLKDEYKAVLLLVEKQGSDVTFTKENMTKIFNNK